MNEEDLTRKRFFEDFEKRFCEEIENLEMANLIANPEVFEKLNLVAQNGLNNLWGLLVFCKSKKVYFYVNPNESMMSAMMRVASQGDLPKEQSICLSDFEGFKVWKEKKHWYDFLLNSKFELLSEFYYQKTKYNFLFNTQNPASEVIKFFN